MTSFNRHCYPCHIQKLCVSVAPNRLQAAQQRQQWLQQWRQQQLPVSTETETSFIRSDSIVVIAAAKGWLRDQLSSKVVSVCLTEIKEDYRASRHHYKGTSRRLPPAAGVTVPAGGPSTNHCSGAVCCVREASIYFTRCQLLCQIRELSYLNLRLLVATICFL